MRYVRECLVLRSVEKKTRDNGGYISFYSRRNATSCLLRVDDLEW